MSDRKVVKFVRGHETVDGAGVHLVRVLGLNTVEDYDPWLMLDSFDSENPDDYIAGFPYHPHRGIETITYLASGEIEHGDSLGNKGTIHGGESQWMTAGSGIIHQEMPKPAKRMLGLQLWLNLPSKQKMTEPKYFDITKDKITSVITDFGTVRIIAGSYGGETGVKPPYIQASLMDISVKAGHEALIPTDPDDNVFIFLLDGDVRVADETYKNKSAVLFGSGDQIRVGAPADADTRFIFCAGRPLHEPVAWAGPIVMNTQEELRETYHELDNDTFIKHAPAH